MIVTDWMMPRMDGKALCEALRREGSVHARIPIVVCSAATQPPGGGGKLYDRFIPKPVGIVQLERGLEEVRRYGRPISC